MKQFVLDASQFDSIGTFFVHADHVLCDNFTSGRNLDAFRDILRGGFGRFDYEEPIEVIWRGSDKSAKDLGEMYGRLVGVIRESCHISFREEMHNKLHQPTGG